MRYVKDLLEDTSKEMIQALIDVMEKNPLEMEQLTFEDGVLELINYNPMIKFCVHYLPYAQLKYEAVLDFNNPAGEKPKMYVQFGRATSPGFAIIVALSKLHLCLMDAK